MSWEFEDGRTNTITGATESISRDGKIQSRLLSVVQADSLSYGLAQYAVDRAGL
jgi:hypothetical protein